MLRPFLYRQLNRMEILGGVMVAHEGEEAAASLIEQASSSRQRLHLTDWGETYRVNCPFCSDRRHRLWIPYWWGMKSKATGTRNLWSMHCFNEECHEEYENQKWLYDQLFANEWTQGVDVIEAQGGEPDKPLTEAVWPGEVFRLRDLPSDHPANTYLRNRRFDPVRLSDALGLVYCNRAHGGFGLAADRIIIPFFQDKQMVGWQSRLMKDKLAPYERKYWTMPGLPVRKVLYNFQNARQRNHVVVCEGVTDVWRYGPEAVALLGKSISGPRVSMLANLRVPIVVMLDGEAETEAYGVRDAIKRADKNARVGVLPLPAGTDPADYEPTYLRPTVRSFLLQMG